MASSAVRRKSVLFCVICVLALIGVLWQTVYWSRQYALDQIEQRGQRTLNLIAESLRGDLDKFKVLPQLISASDASLRDAVTGTMSASELQDINLLLEHINTITGALDTYLMDRNGDTVAASNWASENTFIGRNFAYRPYFQMALQGRLGRYFALGTTSGERGYYFSYPVRSNSTSVGAVVVKMPVGTHEASWKTENQEVIVVDQLGVVFLSSHKDWRFKTLQPMISEATSALLESRQYSDEELGTLNVEVIPDSDGERQFFDMPSANAKSNIKREQFLALETDMLDANWRVILLARTAQVDPRVHLAVLVVLLLILGASLAGIAIYHRRRGLEERITFQERAREQLERRVEERTVELTTANLELRKEIAERKRAEETVQRTQESLVQASKLAALGQMAAGLSHELNQPLAAIRSYADNARAFIERGRNDDAYGNLSGISELTERMSRIIKNLRTYARDGSVDLRPTSLRTALNESLLLMDARVRELSVDVSVTGEAEDLSVMAGDVRLQQVFVNLIANALDAMSTSDTRKLEINVRGDANAATVTFIDTGSGIPDSKLANVFDPFFSTKEVGKGMGMGLSITWGLVQRFGGSIEVKNGEAGGAVVTVSLRRADVIRDKDAVA